MQYSPNSIDNVYIDRQIIQLRKDLITELNQFSYKVENYVNTQLRLSQDINKINLTSSIKKELEQIIQNSLYEKVKIDLNNIQARIEQELGKMVENKFETKLSNKLIQEIKHILDINVKPELDEKIFQLVKKETQFQLNHSINKEIKKQISSTIENQLAIERKIMQKEYEDRIRLIEHTFQVKIDNILQYTIAREQEFASNFTSTFDSMMQKYIQNHMIYQPQTQLNLYPETQALTHSQSYYDFIETNKINKENKKEIDTVVKNSSSLLFSNELEDIKLNSSAPEFVPKYLKK